MTEVQVCGAWGNAHLAFVNVVARFERSDEIGYRVLLAVLSADGTRPHLLALNESPGIVPQLWERERLEPAETPSPIAAPELVAPSDEVTVLRVNRMPRLVWRPSTGADRFVYLLEWQFSTEPAKRPRRWQEDHLMLVPIEPATSRVTVRAPFRANYFVNRWRVWAIDRTGDVARSDWRFIYVH